MLYIWLTRLRYGRNDSPCIQATALGTADESTQLAIPHHCEPILSQRFHAPSHRIKQTSEVVTRRHTPKALPWVPGGAEQLRQGGVEVPTNFTMRKLELRLVARYASQIREP